MVPPEYDPTQTTDEEGNTYSLHEHVGTEGFGYEPELFQLENFRWRIGGLESDEEGYGENEAQQKCRDQELMGSGERDEGDPKQ